MKDDMVEQLRDWPYQGETFTFICKEDKSRLARAHLEAMRDEMQKAHLYYYAEHLYHIIKLLEKK